MTMMMIMMMMMMITIMMMMMMMMMCFPKTFFLYQSDWRCLNASFQLNKGTRKVGLLALKIILDGSPFHMDIGTKRLN